MLKLLLSIVAASTLVGCAIPPPQPVKFYSSNGASMDKFLSDRYACYQETQQRISSAGVNQFGGSSNSQVIPSCGAFSACLAARGYILSDKGNLEVPQGAIISCHK